MNGPKKNAVSINLVSDNWDKAGFMEIFLVSIRMRGVIKRGFDTPIREG